VCVSRQQFPVASKNLDVLYVFIICDMHKFLCRVWIDFYIVLDFLCCGCLSRIAFCVYTKIEVCENCAFSYFNLIVFRAEFWMLNWFYEDTICPIFQSSKTKIPVFVCANAIVRTVVSVWILLDLEVFL